MKPQLHSSILIFSYLGRHLECFTIRLQPPTNKELCLLIQNSGSLSVYFCNHIKPGLLTLFQYVHILATILVDSLNTSTVHLLPLYNKLILITNTHLRSDFRSCFVHYFYIMATIVSTILYISKCSMMPR